MQEDSDKKGEKPLTRRQQSTLKRRKHIVESAARCFIEHGFHQTSIRDIAKQAGVSLGNLYNHFESKTDLIAEIATLEADDLASIFKLLDTVEPGFDGFEVFVAAYFKYVSRPENAVLTAEITAEAMRNPEIVEKYTSNRNQILDAIVKLLSSEEMVFPETKQVMAEMVLDLIESVATRTAFGKASTKASTLKNLRSALKRLLCINVP